MTRRTLFLAGLLALVLAPSLAAQARVTVTGTLLDAETGVPIEGAAIDIPGREIRAATDGRGWFRLEGVAPGTRVFRVRHIGYGTHTERIVVPEGSDFTLELRLTAQALLLESIDVTVDRRERTESTRSNVINRTMIQSVEGRARHVGDLVRSFIPGAAVSEARGGFLCIEFRAARANRIAGCNYPLIVMDGLPVVGEPRFLRDLTVEDLERVEYVPASEGSARYGVGATHGVLLIETRRSGIVKEPEPFHASRFPNYRWSQEPAGHPLARAYAGATAGALGGALIGLAAIGCLPGGQGGGACVEGVGTGSALSALTLPLIGSTLGALLLGGTPASRGRWLPSVLMTALPASVGYTVYVDGERTGFIGERLLGIALITVATPLVSTLSDHLFRYSH